MPVYDYSYVKRACKTRMISALRARTRSTNDASKMYIERRGMDGWMDAGGYGRTMKKRGEEEEKAMGRANVRA